MLESGDGDQVHIALRGADKEVIAGRVQRERSDAPAGQVDDPDTNGTERNGNEANQMLV